MTAASAPIWQNGYTTPGTTCLKPATSARIPETAPCWNCPSSIWVTVTIDADFGELIYRRNVPRAGLIRLPDASTEQRIDLVAEIIVRYRQELKNRAIVTVRGEHIRVSNSPNN